MLSLSVTSKFYEEVISMDGNILLNVFCAIIWGFVLVGRFMFTIQKRENRSDIFKLSSYCMLNILFATIIKGRRK